MRSTRLRSLLASAAAVTALATGLAGCGGSTPEAATETTGEPVSGGTLTFYDPVEYTAWAPTNSIWSNSQVSGNLAERLVWQDPKTGDFKPWLAASWEISDDHLTYTFTLKDGITFSNGDPLDAETVKLNFDQHGLGDKALGIPVDPFWGDYAGTDVVDALHLQVRLTKPNAGFLQILSNYRASSILGKPFLALDLNGQGKLENWVGTGPFVVESVSGTTGVTLTRRADYDWAPEGSAHQGEAYLEKVVFKTVPEASTRVGALQSGEAQVSRNIAPYDEETVTSGGGQLVAIPIQGQTNALTVQLDAHAPTLEKDVRLALQAATDREEINATVLSPSYPVPTSLLVQGTPLRGESSDHLTYDLDKAKSLLDKAGWKAGTDGIREKDGQRLHFEIWVAPYYQVSQAVLELLQSQWKKAGVELHINSASLTEYEAVQAARGDTWTFAQGQSSTADPSVLRAAYASYRQNSTHNPTPDATLDELLGAQALEFDPEKRKAAVQDIEDYVLEQGYSIPLYDETQVFGLAPDVHGFATESTGRSWLYDTWIGQ
ncbi:ABC transporter substrate-binding protein [Cellulomonas chitinilytica]|uniref:ABC transporter substrate-binding protein n=1 Tax=Cellulomonas chitinilytica TaxID=398759 RepID=A0A919NXQ5_9CELL|nr:ABC transporter substrate-binding protein [Cellulomonas chitinilytica]GIG19541.1 ABC transporter substrate-binding protein [Cellulomonas chitinilytica]